MKKNNPPLKEVNLSAVYAEQIDELKHQLLESEFNNMIWYLRGTEAGANRAIEELRERLESEFNEYLTRVYHVAFEICSVVNSVRKNSFHSVRAKFHLKSKFVELFCVFESTFEEEIKIGDKMADLSRKLLVEKDCPNEIMFINALDRDIDFEAIKSDYPHLLTIKSQ